MDRTSLKKEISLLKDNKVMTKAQRAVKRSHDGPLEGVMMTRKRSVLGDLTNAEIVQANLTADDSVFKSSQGSISECDENCLIRTEVKDSSYVTALDDSEGTTSAKPIDPTLDSIHIPPIPSDIEDFDEATANDRHAESVYAMHIFQYYKEREKKFIIKDYMHRQSELTKTMRAVLVDWMVEVQESFELNHETLYLAVKLVDLYLMKNLVTKTKLQLVGATAVWVACKFDERLPPIIDDFLYICDDSYVRDDIIKMEKEILQAVDYELGIPSSYRFLRRYARTIRATMEMLTLARYILELSLLDYELIGESDSKLAAAALLLALKMFDQQNQWLPALQYYSGYQEDELQELVEHLNRNVATPPSKNLRTIRTKYSHSIFYGVAKREPLNI